MAKVSITTMEQLANALENANFNDADITALRGYKKLEDFKSVLRGYAQIVVATHIINMTAPSTRTPKDWEVRPDDQLPNRASDSVEWNPAATSLFLSEKQKTNYIGGPDLKKELGKLKDQLVVTDAVVDFYLDHPEIPTPEAWLGKWIVCWGRIYYRSSGGYLIVRSLRCYDDSSRSEDYHYVGNYFYSYYPALVVAAGK